jgi:hypothetical protein
VQGFHFRRLSVRENGHSVRGQVALHVWRLIRTGLSKVIYRESTVSVHNNDLEQDGPVKFFTSFLDRDSLFLGRSVGIAVA